MNKNVNYIFFFFNQFTKNKFENNYKNLKQINNQEIILHIVIITKLFIKK